MTTSHEKSRGIVLFFRIIYTVHCLLNTIWNRVPKRVKRTESCFTILHYYTDDIFVLDITIGDLSRAVRSLNATRFGVYHSLFEWFNPLWIQDKESNLTTRNFVTNKVLPELYDLV